MNRNIRNVLLKNNNIKIIKIENKIENKIINTDLFYDNLKPMGNPQNKKYTAIIVEPRKHKALEFVIKNFTDNLGDDWIYVIMCSNFNKDYVEEIKNRLNLDLHLIIITENNLNIQNYNLLLTNKKFYEIIPTEILLIFQTDSIILKENKNNIYDFMEYDYVGAPWATNKLVGNGGLSLRRKSKMIEIIEKVRYNNINEDMYFSLSKNEIKMNIPKYGEAVKFSVETMYYDKPFGIHKIWIHLKKENYINLIKLYPDIEILKNLQ